MSNCTNGSKPRQSVTLPIGAILAGGASRRMGEAKAIKTLVGKTLLDRVIESLAEQVSALVIIGGQKVWATDRHLHHRSDIIDGGRGPLAGILTAIDHAISVNAGAGFVFVTATDLPFLPPGLVAGLLKESGADVPVMPCSQGRLQPLASLWPLSLRDRIAVGLEDNSLSSLKDLYMETGVVEVAWDKGSQDPFFNLNTPDDFATAEHRIKGQE